MGFNSQNKFASIIDGTSNTLAVSECGAWIYQDQTTKVDVRPSAVYGFNMGSVGRRTNTPNPIHSSDANASRIFNPTTLRYGIKQVRFFPADCGDGVCANHGNNTPLRSQHPGGVLAAFGDGSVHFLADTLDIRILAHLAAKDDGEPVNLP